MVLHQRRRRPGRDERQRRARAWPGSRTVRARRRQAARRRHRRRPARRSTSSWTRRRRRGRAARRSTWVRSPSTRSRSRSTRRARSTSRPTFDGAVYRGDAAGVGNPHLVLFVDDPAPARVTAHGPLLEHDARFPSAPTSSSSRVTADGDARRCGCGSAASARRCRAAPARARRPRSRTAAGWSATVSSSRARRDLTVDLGATRPPRRSGAPHVRRRRRPRPLPSAELRAGVDAAVTPRRPPAAPAHRHRGRPRRRPPTRAAGRTGVDAHDVDEAEASLAELALLADTAGADAGRDRAASAATARPRHLRRQGQGRGAAELAEALDVDVVVFDDELSPAQQRNLEKLFKRRRRRPRRADPRHLRPARPQPGGHGPGGAGPAALPAAPPAGPGRRSCRQQGGGIGTRGPGETQLEVDRRRILRRITKLERDSKQLARTRATQRKARRRSDLATVALVGYTNAGKSTLLNRLTGAGVLVEDRLFSTLDPTTRRLRLPGGETCCSPTRSASSAGCPHQLVESFRSTLEEVVDADLLLHVVDAGLARARPPDRGGPDGAARDRAPPSVPELLVVNKIDIADPTRWPSSASHAGGGGRVGRDRRGRRRAAARRSATGCGRSTRWSSCRSPTTGATCSPPCTGRARCSSRSTTRAPPGSGPGCPRRDRPLRRTTSPPVPG